MKHSFKRVCEALKDWNIKQKPEKKREMKVK